MCFYLVCQRHATPRNAKAHSIYECRLASTRIMAVMYDHPFLMVQGFCTLIMIYRIQRDVFQGSMSCAQGGFKNEGPRNTAKPSKETCGRGGTTAMGPMGAAWGHLAPHGPPLRCRNARSAVYPCMPYTRHSCATHPLRTRYTHALHPRCTHCAMCCLCSTLQHLLELRRCQGQAQPDSHHMKG